MKVIDVLNKMANGEEIPTKIKYNYITWEWNEKQKDYIELNGATRNLFTYYLDNLTKCLNNGIEIIEEPKEVKLPEKLLRHYNDNVEEEIMLNRARINMILDYLKAKEDKGSDK